MRKNIAICLIFTILIMFGECTRIQLKQGTLIGENGAHILKKSSLGRALFQMIEMYTSSTSTQRDFTQLFQTLDLLKQSLLGRQSDENALFDEDGSTHQTAVQRISQQITTLTEQQIILENDLTSLNELKEELQVDLLNLQTEQSAAESSLKSEQQLVQKLITDFETEDLEFNQALQVLEEAVSYLNEAYLEHEAAFSAFVQKNVNRIEEISILLETDVKRISRSKFLYVEVLKNIFLEMKSGNKIDSEAIQQAVYALNDLHGYLTQGKEQLKIDFDTQRELHENMIQQLSNTIKLLTEQQIPNTQRYIANNQEQIDIKTESLEETIKNLEQEKENLRLENESWDQRVEYHNLLISQLQSEVAIVEQAESILQNYRG